MQYDGFHHAYLHNLNEIYTNYDFINNPRGNRSYEKLNINFTISNPVERICYIPARKTNIVFNFAETLWYLSGDKSLRFIGYYSDTIKQYSSDGITLSGSAYGPKIMRYGSTKLNQWDRIVRILGTEDPDSKRAMIGIFDPNEDLSLQNIDVSCTLGFQFLLRNNELHMIAFMRANDAYRGMVSDIFSFTFIHELLARQLGVDIGNYYHVVGSMHIYHSDEVRVQQVLQAAPNFPAPDQHGPEQTFPKMPATNNWPYLLEIIEIEKILRESNQKISMLPLEKKLPEYWFQIILLLKLYKGIKAKRPDTALLERLSPVYKRLVVNRWENLAI